MSRCKGNFANGQNAVTELLWKMMQYAISELPLASSSKRVLVLILWCENEISFTRKLNSLSYERMSTKPRFEEEANGKNSEMAYLLTALSSPADGSKPARRYLTRTKHIIELWLDNDWEKPARCLIGWYCASLVNGFLTNCLINACFFSANGHQQSSSENGE